MVTVILSGVGLPIAWRMLPKRTKPGNSNHFHRARLMEEVLAILPVADIKPDRCLRSGGFKNQQSSSERLRGRLFRIEGKDSRKPGDAFLELME